LAQSREQQALETLKKFWQRRLSPELRRAVLVSLGGSPLPEAAEFLLSLVADESNEVSEKALAALAASRFRGDLKERIAAVVETKQDPILKQIFERQFPKTEVP